MLDVAAGPGRGRSTATRPARYDAELAAATSRSPAGARSPRERLQAARSSRRSTPAYTGTLTVTLDACRPDDRAQRGRSRLDGQEFEYLRASTDDTVELARPAGPDATDRSTSSERFRARRRRPAARSRSSGSAAARTWRGMDEVDGALERRAARARRTTPTSSSTLDTLAGGIDAGRALDDHARRDRATTTSPAAAARTCCRRRSTSGSPTTTRPACSCSRPAARPASPSRRSFVVLGDGFVTEVLTNHTFKGDFGTAMLGEVAGNNSRVTAPGPRARQVEPQHASEHRRPRPGAGRDADAVRGAPDRARRPATASSDWFRFKITPQMLATAGGNGVQAAFDIDRGFAFGDPIIWLSLLRHLQRNRATCWRRATASPTRSTPTSGRGSPTWLDDYLTYTFTDAGRLLRRGRPLAVLERPAERRRLRAATSRRGATRPPACCSPRRRWSRTSSATATTPQAIDFLSFFRFFDPTVGDAWIERRAGSTGLTPYARIQGSGDGSFDLFSFTSTQDMLNPPALTSQNDLVVGARRTRTTFFTSVDLRLTGRVTPGDVWRLGIRYRDYSYEVEDGETTLAEVIDGLIVDIQVEDQPVHADARRHRRAADRGPVGLQPPGPPGQRSRRTTPSARRS